MYESVNQKELDEYLQDKFNSPHHEAQVVRLHPNAKLEKRNDQDTGYDIWAIDIDRERSTDDVIMFKTGWKIKPPKGYDFKVFPRSSICKTDYMLANGVGVCDETYRGEYMIPFRKMKDNPTPIELPCKLAQLNLQKRETCVFRLVDELDDTIRGSGGFGSTGS